MPRTNPSTFNPKTSPAALHYNSALSLWLSVDPLSDKYPNLSPYVYCANNPVRLVDVDGREVSTHTDKDGNVLAVYDDNYLGIFKHTDAEVSAFHNGADFENDYNELVGFTLCVKSFKSGDKIDFGSYEASDWMRNFESSFTYSSVNYLSCLYFYITNAGNGQTYDTKSYLHSGSQLSEGVYVSPRDLGNFAAGRFCKMMNISKTRTLASFGAYELSGNNKTKFLKDYSAYYGAALRTSGKDCLDPQQKTYGEKAISNYFQRLGYENIRTIRDFNSNYYKIWED